MKRVVLILISLFLTNAAEAQRQPIDDVEEERATRSDLFPHLEQLPDGPSIRASFEKAFQKDPTGAPALLALTQHADEEVSSWAGRIVGRYETQEVVATLSNVFRTDTRLLTRTGALGGLIRSGDLAAATLAIQALAEPSDEIQVLGLLALEALGSAAQGQALLNYLDSSSRRVPPEEVFPVLGKLGDAAGSTAVRDRLAAEANNKSNSWKPRLEAAKSLRTMGQDQLAQLVLDRSDSDATYERLIRFRAAVRKTAATRESLLKSQGDLDAVLLALSLPAIDRVDAWGRPIRAVSVSVGTLKVVSDGPDRIPNTPDDISTSERFAAYDARMFSSLFR